MAMLILHGSLRVMTMFKWVRRNWLWETHREEMRRRMEAIERHITDLESRRRVDNHTHLREFHPGQNGKGAVKEPEEG
jgi:hypothetical protein